MSTTHADLPVTLSDKPKRWDFTSDSVTPGRLVAWGGEIACAAALVAPMADVPWFYGAAAGLTFTSASVLYEKSRGAWRRVIAARAASWLTSTGWLSYALHAGPSWPVMGAGIVVWGAGAAVNLGMDSWGETTAAAEKILDEKIEEGEKIAAKQNEWSKIIEEICGIEGVTIDPVFEFWASGAGYTAKLTLPDHLNVDSLTGYEAQLAGRLKLPKGGGINFLAGGPDDPRNVVYMAVTKRDMMSSAVAYPTLDPSSINDPVYFGQVSNGDRAGLNLKDEGFIAVGAQGSGKTALMKCLGLGVVRCVDAVLWDMDTSAKMSATFVNPWLRHGIGVPLVDWAATSEDECRVMVQAAKDAIAARKTEYSDLLEDEDLDNLPARPDIPAIVIRVDETKSMPMDVVQGLDLIIEEGRSVNVRVSNTGLSATRDYISKAMDELTPGRIGLRTNNASELAMFFPGFGAPDMSIFTKPGVVVYMSATKGPYQPVPARVWATMPEAFPEGSQDRERMSSLMTDAARELSPVRPAMDPITEKAMGPAYTQRWARCIPLLRGDAYGNLDESRMHKTVWDLYQSWDKPVPYATLLGNDEDGDDRMRNAKGATIPSPAGSIFDEDEIERAAQQQLALDMAGSTPKALDDEELVVEFLTKMDGPARPSDIYPSMKAAGYSKSDRTFRDLCRDMAIAGKLTKEDGGKYAVPISEDESGPEALPEGIPGSPGPEHDAS